MTLKEWLDKALANADKAVTMMELKTLLKGGWLSVGPHTSYDADKQASALHIPKRGEWQYVSPEFPQYVTFESSSPEKALKDYYNMFGKKEIAAQTKDSISFTDGTKVELAQRFRPAKSAKSWDGGTTYYTVTAIMDTGDEFILTRKYKRFATFMWEPLQYFEFSHSDTE